MSSKDLTAPLDIIEFLFALCTVQTNTILEFPTYDGSVGMRGSNHFDELPVFLFPCLRVSEQNNLLFGFGFFIYHLTIIIHSVAGLKMAGY